MDSILEVYIRAARRMESPDATMADRLAFLALHNARNVAALGTVLDELREENTRLMETLYGGLDEPDKA
jgi:hypothetical protein